jgi:hypothetical protein
MAARRVVHRDSAQGGFTAQPGVADGAQAHALQHYLPDAFGPKDLEIKTLLMDHQDHGFPVRCSVRS